MSDVATLKQYLVGLGFNVNTSQLRQFETALKSASKMVKGETANIALDMVKWQGSVVGMFAAITAAIVTTADKVAMGDQNFRLFGERMFMSTERARNFKIAIDALGQSPGAIVFDPELFSRFKHIRQIENQMTPALGADYGDTMRKIRDIHYEFTYMGVELQFLTMAVVPRLFKALGFGSGDFLKDLRKLNEWIVTNLPHIADVVSTNLVPVWNDAMKVFVAIGHAAQGFFDIYRNLLGLMIGDKSIMGAQDSWQTFAKTVSGTMYLLTNFFDVLAAGEERMAKLVQAGGALANGDFKGAGSLLVQAGSSDYLKTMAKWFSSGNMTWNDFEMQQLRATAGKAVPAHLAPLPAGGDVANQAKAAALQVGKQLGVDPSVIYAQWAFETNGFKSIAANNNLAGIRFNGKFADFGSVGDFGSSFANQIQRNWKGSMGAGSDFGAYVGGLYNGRLGNYSASASMEQYKKGLQSHLGDYARAGGASTIISTGDINVYGTNLTGDQVKHHVLEALNDKAKVTNQRNQMQFSPVVN